MASGATSPVGFTYDTVDRKGEWRGEQYDYVQETLLINHVAVGVPVGRMRAPFIGLGCDAFDFETVDDETTFATSADTSPAPTGPAAAPAIPAPQIVKPIVTLTPTDEKTGNLIDKLKQLANFQGL